VRDRRTAASMLPTATEFQAALQQVSQIGGVKLTGGDVMTGSLRSPVAAMTGSGR